MVNVNSMSLVFSNTAKPASLFFLDSSLPNKLLDESVFPVVRSYITESENEFGDYDYSKVSNIGMVYLYIHRKNGSRKVGTKKEYVRELLQFLRYTFEQGIEDIREMKRGEIEAYQEWISNRYPKTKTQAKKITILTGFLSWSFNENYLKIDLTRGLIGVKLDKHQIPDREISESSLQSAFQYYSNEPKFLSLLLILASTGLRLNEIITPLWKDLYFDSIRNKYYLRTKTKRDGERHAHIKDFVLQVLKEYRRRLGLSTAIDPNDETPFYPNRYRKHYLLSSLSATVSKKLAEANFQTVRDGKTTAHYFRHYFARSAYNSGAPVDKIAKTLDHSTSRTTEDNYLSRDINKENDVSDFVVLPGFEDTNNREH